MRDLIRAAITCAAEAHAGQFRMDGRTPYFAHLARVGQAVSEIFPSDYQRNEIDYPMVVAAAYLHDLLEDTPRDAEYLSDHFGHPVRRLVVDLTNVKYDTNRDEQKFLDRLRLQSAHAEARIIKLVDRLDNLQDMESADQQFKNVYARESIALADALVQVGKCPDFFAHWLQRLHAEIRQVAMLLFQAPKEKNAAGSRPKPCDSPPAV